jgi:hypothetical protein
LVPTLYGGEAVREKARHATRQWAESDLFAALAEYLEPSIEAALRQIYESAKQYPPVVTAAQQVLGGHFYWGTGKYPSVGAWYVVEGRAVAVWSIYTDPTEQSSRSTSSGWHGMGYQSMPWPILLTL